MDDASNGIFLRIPSEDVSVLSRHQGYLSIYNDFVKMELDKMDLSVRPEILEKQVYELQNRLRMLQQKGLPIYPNQGASIDLWRRSFERMN